MLTEKALERLRCGWKDHTEWVNLVKSAMHVSQIAGRESVVLPGRSPLPEFRCHPAHTQDQTVQELCLQIPRTFNGHIRAPRIS